jgi:hypothetical protein
MTMKKDEDEASRGATSSVQAQHHRRYDGNGGTAMPRLKKSDFGLPKGDKWNRFGGV